MRYLYNFDLQVSEENQEIRKQNKLGSNTTIVAQNNNNNGIQETKGELEGIL